MHQRQIHTGRQYIVYGRRREANYATDGASPNSIKQGSKLQLTLTMSARVQEHVGADTMPVASTGIQSMPLDIQTGMQGNANGRESRAPGHMS